MVNILLVSTVHCMCLCVCCVVFENKNNVTNPNDFSGSVTPGFNNNIIIILYNALFLKLLIK